MKRSVFQLALLVLVMVSGNALAQGTVFLSEGFEEGEIPTGWTEQRMVGTFYWQYRDGGGESPSAPGFRHPSFAHTGSYNALFQVQGGDPTSRLITPTMDLRFSIKPVLSFWLAQDIWDEGTDELRIYYRTSPSSSWIVFDPPYLSTITEWSYREIVLPAEAKVEKFQLAFEAKSNYGWGICIDDVKVDERGYVPRSVSSLVTHQVNDYLPSGTNVNPIAFVEVIVTGNTNSLYLTGANFSYTGTSISDINSFKLYYTPDSTFSSSSPLPLSLTLPMVGNSIQFSGGQQVLSTGLNYVWLCADIKSIAVHGNQVDVTVPAVAFTIGGNQYPSVTQNPSGHCTIEESIAAFDFESSSGWTLNNSWAIGAPTGGGTYDPTLAYSGQNVLATNLTGNYPPGITAGNEHRATMNSLSTKYFQNVYIRYKRWLNVESTDKARVWASNDEGSTWLKLMENTLDIKDRYWKSISHDINNYATRKDNVIVRFAIDESDGNTEYGGWNIDNFAITGDFIAKDVGVSSIILPTTHCGMTSAETVTVKIKNYGGAAVNVKFNVGFSLDNGVTYTTEEVTPPLPNGIEINDEYTYTFTAKANLSQLGLKQLKFKTFLTGDEDFKNDAISTTLFVYPTLSYIYSNSFESTSGYWNPSGANSSWVWGIPNASVIDTASNGTKAWVTNLTGSHNSSEVSYLESPCFNFTSSEYPIFSFDYWVNAENGVDGFRLEYSVDGGSTWIPVPEDTNHSQNWCTGTYVSTIGSDGWTGITASAYATAKTLLPISGANKVTGVGSVKFRFAYASNDANSYEGVAIDNIKIYELPYDVGIKRLASPISDCYIGNNVKLTAKITNYGYRPLKVGLKVPIEIKLRNENKVKDTLVVGSLVPKNDSTTFISTGTYNIFSKGSHALTLNTNFSSELNRTNDTLKRTLLVRGVPGYSIGPDKAVTTTQLAAGVELDAGLNGLVPYNNYKWSTAETTRKITVTSFGEYIDTVTNENGCEAIDTINVIESTSDITILSVTGLSNSCTYPSSVKPEIAIKNLGPNPVGPSSTVTKTIPLSIMIDGAIIVNETFTPLVDIAPDETVNYTFTNDIDISTPNTYNIGIYSKINEDPDKTNDTIKVATQVWGLPDVNLPFDTIATYQADTLQLDAGLGFASYTWQDNTHNQTYVVTSLNSGWYKVTVTDVHVCGSDKDSVYINASDLRIVSITSPSPSFCNNESLHVSVLVENSGRDVFPADTVIHVSYFTPNESKTHDFNFETPLSPGSSKLLTFTNFVNIPEGDGFLRVEAKVNTDPFTSNNFIERSTENRISPTVSFDPSTIQRIFGTAPYTISPIYSSNVQSYAWKYPNWADLGFDSLYTIEGNPPGRSLHVIAYENLGQSGCKDTATLTIISDDIAIDAIKSPANSCELSNSTPVTITIANTGNFTYPLGTNITYSVNLDGNPAFDETIPLSTDLLSKEKRDVTLSLHTLDLGGKTSATVEVSISTTALDIVASNNTLNKTVYSTHNPIVDLGGPRTIHSWKDTLRTTEKFDTYSWKHNSVEVGTDSIFAASESGTYSVTVTDFNGCTGTSNDLVLTFVVDDVALKTLDKPVTSCGLKNSEAVRVTIENNGTETISAPIEIGFKQNGKVKKTQTFDLTTSPLLATESRSFDLTDQMDFSAGYVEYPVKVWVKMDGDMTLDNDTLPSLIDRYAPALFTFDPNSSIVSPTPFTLDAGAGFSSYNWSTGATSQSILISTSGDYWVEVSNSHGCIARDTAHVRIGEIDIAVDSLISPQTPTCSISTVTVRLKNPGANVIPKDTLINLTLKVNSSTIATESYTFTNSLAIGATFDYTFISKPNLSSPTSYVIEVSVQMAGDYVSTNNSKTKNITVYGNPSPSLGLDRYFTTPVILDPGTFTSYLWSTSATSPTITVSTSGTYSVTVTDANGCQGSDDVILTLQDVRATQLISPSTNCYNSQGQTVTVELTNVGTRAFSVGDHIDVSYQVGMSPLVVETMTLPSVLANSQTVRYTFNQKALIDIGTTTMILKTIISGINGVSSNPYTVTISTKPALDLGDDTVRTELPYTIVSGIANVSYLWSTGSTNASITVYEYGKYTLTVTNGAACTAKDSVVLKDPSDNVATIAGTNAVVKLFPNPVNDELTITIETDKYDEFTIDMINPSGQIVKNLKTDKALYYISKINVSGYSSGIYFIKVSNSKGSAVFKVVVQR